MRGENLKKKCRFSLVLRRRRPSSFILKSVKMRRRKEKGRAIWNDWEGGRNKKKKRNYNLSGVVYMRKRGTFDLAGHRSSSCTSSSFCLFLLFLFNFLEETCKTYRREDVFWLSQVSSPALPLLLFPIDTQIWLWLWLSIFIFSFNEVEIVIISFPLFFFLVFTCLTSVISIPSLFFFLFPVA